MEYIADTDRLKEYLRIAESVIEDEKGAGAAKANPHLVGALIQALAMERLSVTLEHDVFEAQVDSVRVLEDIRLLLSNSGE